jgi:hypothetical protein
MTSGNETSLKQQHDRAPARKSSALHDPHI